MRGSFPANTRTPNERALPQQTLDEIVELLGGVGRKPPAPARSFAIRLVEDDPKASLVGCSVKIDSAGDAVASVSLALVGLLYCLSVIESKAENAVMFYDDLWDISPPIPRTRFYKEAAVRFIRSETSALLRRIMRPASGGRWEALEQLMERISNRSGPTTNESFAGNLWTPLLFIAVHEFAHVARGHWRITPRIAPSLPQDALRWHAEIDADVFAASFLLGVGGERIDDELVALLGSPEHPRQKIAHWMAISRMSLTVMSLIHLDEAIEREIALSKRLSAARDHHRDILDWASRDADYPPAAFRQAMIQRWIWEKAYSDVEDACPAEAFDVFRNWVHQRTTSQARWLDDFSLFALGAAAFDDYDNALISDRYFKRYQFSFHEALSRVFREEMHGGAKRQ